MQTGATLRTKESSKRSVFKKRYNKVDKNALA